MNWIPCHKCGKVKHASEIVEIHMIHSDTFDRMPFVFHLCKSCADEIKAEIKNVPHVIEEEG